LTSFWRTCRWGELLAAGADGNILGDVLMYHEVVPGESGASRAVVDYSSDFVDVTVAVRWDHNWRIETVVPAELRCLSFRGPRNMKVTTYLDSALNPRPEQGVVALPGDSIGGTRPHPLYRASLMTIEPFGRTLVSAVQQNRLGCCVIDASPTPVGRTHGWIFAKRGKSEGVRRKTHFTLSKGACVSRPTEVLGTAHQRFVP